MNINSNNHSFFNLKSNWIIFLISLTIIFSKWSVSYFFFPLESFDLKIFLDSQSIMYFPYLINLTELDFKPDYVSGLISDNLLTIPIYSIIINSFFFLLLKNYSFIIIEIIFNKYFFKNFVRNFKKNKFIRYTIFFSCNIFLCLPVLSSKFLNTLDITIIGKGILNNLYSFRFPRPLITSLYLLWGIYLIILIFEKNYKNHLIILFGIVLGLNFGSFYFHFVELSFLFLLIIILEIFFLQRIEFKKIIKKLIILSISFLIVALPYIYLIIYAEPDFLSRMGAITLGWEQKKLLTSYYFSKILSFEFVILFLFNSIICTYLISTKHIYNKKSIIVLYFLFLSSIFSPIIFFLLSPTISEVHHFINFIIIFAIFSLIILLFIFFLVIFHNYINIKKNFYIFNLILIFFTILLIFIFNFDHYLHQKTEIHSKYRNDIFLLDKYFKSNKKKLHTLLSFQSNIQVWWLLNKKRNLSTVDSSFVSLTNTQLEFNLFNNFKFLQISNQVFEKLLENNKEDGRTDAQYENNIIKYISLLKYQANSLYTFNNSFDFDSKELNFIKKTSPLKTDQIIIPKNEKDRLVNLYKNYTQPINQEIDLIVLKKNTLISNNAKLDKKKFCKLGFIQELDIYINIKKAKCSF